MSIFDDISAALQAGKKKIVEELVQKAIDEGHAPGEILEKGLLSAMDIIGGKFKSGEAFIPEVLVAARAMNAGTALLKPLLATEAGGSRGRVVIGTVHGDLHDIGKNIVKMMLEGKGLEVIDLGVDVPAEKFIETAINENCKIIACSALLTTTMPAMADIIKKAVEAGIRDKVKIMIGGAPVTQQFCDDIGADAYTPDAATAAEVAVRLLAQ